ncbi:alpha/beta hydrolase [Streptomyces sp. 3MP-14]|uniref:Alpha/beta hydrolase n=1 Tax=Streptomyces mimosae TaxID=2586635 RepID=A0A5N6ANK7_9ACTN|nr:MULTISPECIES: alpha/beta hydrolase [Streptomyces]KAB8169636.1 alpha/beta hydrolase [Streptomyces mimosae]KAB8178384.1 alpha/beta hydrolase [Streptomyces sp. 3MP-14]
MNSVEELKQFVVVHSRAQGLPGELYEGVLTRIEHDGEGPGSWTAEWSAAAERLAEEGNLLAACQCWNTARFPFVNGPARAEALTRCVDAYGRWSAEQANIRRIEVQLDDGSAGPKGRFFCWAGGLSPTEERPLLLLMGGIVSVKEQWAPALAQAEATGMAMVAAELPGVGENTLTYTPDSWRMLPALLDALAEHGRVGQVYAAAMSFSGHLALRAALHEPRIRGVVTVGAPVSGFFTDRDWYDRSVPRVTKDTLAHLTGLGPAELLDGLGAFALRDEELAGLRIPVGYTVSLRDEIIPASDVATLRRLVPDLRLNEHDDVHGSPEHVDETRAWTVETVFGMMAPPS